MKTQLILIIGLVLLTGSLSAQEKKASVSLAAAIYEEEVTGNLDKAVVLYLDILKKFPDDRPVAAKTLYHLGLVNEKMGKQKANEYFTRLVNTYPDQTEVVALAKAKLKLSGSSGNKTEGPVTRRILKDASQIGESLTANGKYISKLDRETGDVFHFEIATQQTSRISNKGMWSESDKNFDNTLFSHDGKQIVYSTYTKDWAPTICIRNLDGSGQRTLCTYDKDSNVNLMDWNPNSELILAIKSQSKTDELILISTKEISVKVLKSTSSRWIAFSNARFSPDGQFITFGSVCEGNSPHSDIILMSANGQNEVVIAGHPAEDQILRWTPDGKNLLFLSDRSGTWDLWTVCVARGNQQGEPELVQKDFGYNVWNILGFAPDGSLYYKTDTNSGHLYFGKINLESGKIIEPPAPVTTRYTGLSSQPTWSPNGKNLLYISRRSTVGPGNNILTIRSTETGEERFLSPRLRFVNQMSWAPDGLSIITLGITMGSETGIFRIDAETSAVTKLSDVGLCPKLCPDGKTLVSAYGPIISKSNLETGEKSEITNVGSMFYNLSPDGKEVLFQSDGAIQKVSINGGEPQTLFQDSVRSSYYYGLGWTRDGRYIIVRTRTTPLSKIWRVPAQGGMPLKLDLSVSKMETFALHPDNSRFAFSTNEGIKEELWVLENSLPTTKSVK